MKLRPDEPYNELSGILLLDESVQKDEEIVHAGGGMHRYCAYCTGGAQKINAFVQSINGLKGEAR